ncbi:deoxyguanosine kinase [Thecamonas trahens ATCC 50062]|uniref:Deoxyguanosine kinase n=1 Tax=Thecamonas trahens ATCC 50062 TaxID=461836 RepID=A0A0L0DVI2_THETB|nr:deoxyguanosine kinase [Thecamonas trahens ATCC 50062]KNC56324.1 deoxyguanosine kinase [Thecamonas trahens ATCC 50062]|eukprot:XP_013760841.1 deoxyguanosine kinase [Thecamonas trahens ATCC 50062]
MLVILEGNISAGKSTLAQALGPLLGCKVFMEPTLTNPYLEHFYKDPLKWGLKMQLWLVRQRFYTYIAALNLMAASGQGVILDRSVFSDKVFADKCREDGFISEEGYAYYMALRARMLEALPVPHVTLYLDVDPKECHRRILHERCRECESGIPLDYLAGLHKWYGQFLTDMEAAGSVVVTQNWNTFGDAKSIASSISAAVAVNAGLAPAVRPTLSGAAVDPAFVARFIGDTEAIRDAMVLPYLVDGVEDSDPLPEPIDFDLEAELTVAAEKAAAASAGDAASTVFEIGFDDDSEARETASGDSGAATPTMADDDDSVSTSHTPSPLGHSDPVLPHQVIDDARARKLFA